MLAASGLDVVVVRPCHVYGAGGWFAEEIVARLRQPGTLRRRRPRRERVGHGARGRPRDGARARGRVRARRRDLPLRRRCPDHVRARPPAGPPPRSASAPRSASPPARRAARGRLGPDHHRHPLGAHIEREAEGRARLDAAVPRFPRRDPRGRRAARLKARSARAEQRAHGVTAGRSSGPGSRSGSASIRIEAPSPTANSRSASDLRRRAELHDALALLLRQHAGDPRAHALEQRG